MKDDLETENLVENWEEEQCTVPVEPTLDEKFDNRLHHGLNQDFNVSRDLL